VADIAVFFWALRKFLVVAKDLYIQKYVIFAENIIAEFI